MTTTKTAFVVRMVSREGQVVFYTGKAGAAWATENVADAFGYGTLSGARNRAAVINKMTAIHGFHAIGFDPSLEVSNVAG